MTVAERAEYAIRGESLENDIYELRDRLNAMESAALDGGTLDVSVLYLYHLLIPSSLRFIFPHSQCSFPMFISNLINTMQSWIFLNL